MGILSSTHVVFTGIDVIYIMVVGDECVFAENPHS
jgi:hypothetical protein